MQELQLEQSIVDERYFIERRLNHGSYAEIFLAYDNRDKGKPVIIKALNTSLRGTPDPELERTLIENFENEAKALDQLQHPNIVRRLGHGTAADLRGVPFHYLVLEYLSGGDLLALCRKRPLTLTEALSCVKQITDALAYAHHHHIIHRDIKPGNLLFSDDRRTVKLTDFGVAKLKLHDEEEITRVGSDVYAPPEHHPDAGEEGAHEKLTPAADVYSLAKTIFTAMTGRAPRRFERAAISELPDALLTQSFGQDLLAILCKATATKVAHRYQSVDEFWRDFSRLRTYLNQDAPLDPEATIVRSRPKAEASQEAATAQPDFQPLVNPTARQSHRQDGRIIVELPQPAKAQSVEVLPKDHRSQAALTIPLGSAVSETERSTPHRVLVGAAESLATPEGAPTKPMTETVAPSQSAVAAPAKHLLTHFGGKVVAAIRKKYQPEWWRYVFIAFLLIAVVGITASTYYYFLEQRQNIRFFDNNEGTIANAPRVNLRDEPNDRSTILIELPRDTRVRVYEERNGWLRVKVVGRLPDLPADAPTEGWVWGKLVRLD